VIDEHFDSFQQVYDERFQAKYGYWRPIVEQSVAAFLKCGDLQEGFARVRCPNCKHEMFVAFSCKQRCTCPSCHQKRTLLTAMHVAEDVCFAVAHRQVVLTIPKRLRVHTRFDRKLLGELSSCAWTCLKAKAQRLLRREDVVPGMIGAIQTHGELLHWHPHIHVLITCGAYTSEGDFLELPQFDMERLLDVWQDEVDPLCCPECGGQMKVVSFIEPPQADLIEEILKHCGLWQASSPRAPPDVEGLVLELDAAYSANSIGSPDQADESQELTYIDIDPFLESF